MCVCIIVESHIGVSWKLKNEIPNSHILDQVNCTNVRVNILYVQGSAHTDQQSFKTTSTCKI